MSEPMFSNKQHKGGASFVGSSVTGGKEGVSFTPAPFDNIQVVSPSEVYYTEDDELKNAVMYRAGDGNIYAREVY